MPYRRSFFWNQPQNPAGPSQVVQNATPSGSARHTTCAVPSQFVLGRTVRSLFVPPKLFYLSPLIRTHDLGPGRQRHRQGPSLGWELTD
eukprot:gene16650-biopygen757